MSEWRYWFAEQRGTLLALGIFILMFIVYTANHPAGFNANVVQTASNKGVLLAFIAMAQTLVVITAGIDLSVGMIFLLTNCLASWIVVGNPFETTLGVVGVLVVGALCGALNGAIVIYGRLQPIVATIASRPIAASMCPLPGRFATTAGQNADCNVFIDQFPWNSYPQLRSKQPDPELPDCARCVHIAVVLICGRK